MHPAAGEKLTSSLPQIYPDDKAMFFESQAIGASARDSLFQCKVYIVSR